MFLFRCEQLQSLLVLLSYNCCGSCLSGVESRSTRRDVVLRGGYSDYMASVDYTLDVVSIVLNPISQETVLPSAFCDYIQDKT
jgi:hypothetical protein